MSAPSAQGPVSIGNNVLKREALPLTRSSANWCAECARGRDAARAALAVLQHRAAVIWCEALDEPFSAFPSWLLRITCDRCGKVQLVNESHAPWRDRTLRAILGRMRHNGCGGLAGETELLTGIANMVIRGVVRIAGKVVVAMGALLALSACDAGIGASAAGGALGAVAGGRSRTRRRPLMTHHPTNR